MNKKIVLATPYVRKIARELGIDIENIKGTGKWGNVTEQDIQHYRKEIKESKKDEKIERKKKEEEKEEGEMKEKIPKIEKYQYYQPENLDSLSSKISISSKDQFIKVRGIIKGMVKTMSEACNVPHLGYRDEISVNNLKTVREELKAIAKGKNIKLSFMPFFIKACSLAMKEYPIINSLLSDDKQIVIVRHQHNIGIAMDSPLGLVVPNIKNCEKKSIFDIAEELQHLIDLSEKGKLGLDEMKDTSFTISNIGAIGGTYVHAIMEPTYSTILGIGKFKTLPRYNEKMEVVPTTICNLSFSCDHRFIDGASIGRYSELVRKYLENPEVMLLHMK